MQGGRCDSELSVILGVAADPKRDNPAPLHHTHCTLAATQSNGIKRFLTFELLESEAGVVRIPEKRPVSFLGVVPDTFRQY
jgi:hypothetical protein